MVAVIFQLISERPATFTTTHSSADEVNKVIPSRMRFNSRRPTRIRILFLFSFYLIGCLGPQFWSVKSPDLMRF